jgi:hypothetical protein
MQMNSDRHVTMLLDETGYWTNARPSHLTRRRTPYLAPALAVQLSTMAGLDRFNSYVPFLRLPLSPERVAQGGAGQPNKLPGGPDLLEIRWVRRGARLRLALDAESK